MESEKKFDEQVDVHTPLIGDNSENENAYLKPRTGAMEPHNSEYGYDEQASRMESGLEAPRYPSNGHHSRTGSGSQVYPTADYPSLDTTNKEHLLGFNHIPGLSSQPQTLVVRNRKKSTPQIQEIFEFLDQLDGDDDDSFIQHTMEKRRELSRRKTLKERRLERQASHEDASLKPKKTLAERYAELKDGEGVNAKNLATLMRIDRRSLSSRRNSTMKRMKKLTGANDSRTWRNMKQSYRDFTLRISLWYSTFKKIEGEYGTAVMTYFRFLKWLLKLNMYIMFITFCVITIPYLALGPSSYEDSVRGMNSSEKSINCTLEYIQYHQNFTEQESVGEKIIDFLQGTGWMERTVLFYGVYHNKTYYNVIEKKEMTYNMALAYLLAVGVSFLICFLLIIKNAAKRFKVTLGQESKVASYTNKVFAAWDYAIKNQKAAKVKSASIKYEITADLKEEERINKWNDMDLGDRCSVYFRRVLINLVVIILLGGSLALIGYTTQKMLELQEKEHEEIVILIIQYVPYITITILNLGMPIIFQILVRYEMYRYESELTWTLVRSVLLRLASPIVLLAILYNQLIYTVGDESTGKCGNNKWTNSGQGVRGDVKCWESYVGQQIYKLVLIDLFVECGIILLVNIPRSYVYRRWNHKKLIKMIGPQEFDLTQSVVDIVYSQNICWLGMMLSPLIPFMTFVKMFIFFYAKILLLKWCEAQDRPYRTSRSNSLFIVFLLLSFIFSAVPVGYMIGGIQPSQSCGPFRLYTEQDVVMFNTITNTIASWPSVVRDFFNFIGTVGFFVPVIILLCLLMYYYWLLGQGYKKTEKVLQHQLKMEGYDKRYLMNRVIEFLQSTEVNQNTLHNADL